MSNPMKKPNKNFSFQQIKLKPNTKKKPSEKKKIKIRELKGNIEIKELKDISKNKKQKIEIREKAFIEVFQPGFSSPVLSKMQTASAGTDLEDIAQTAPKPKTDDRDEKKGEFSYLPSQGGKDEAKYVGSESIKYSESRTISHEQAIIKRRDIFETPKIDFFPSQKKSNEQMYEQYAPVEKFDTEKERKKDLFKKPEIKYTPSKY